MVMDPNETLRLLRLTLKQMQVDEHRGVLKAHAEEALEHFEALDEWLSKGGFLPEDWRSVEHICNDVNPTSVEECAACRAEGPRCGETIWEAGTRCEFTEGHDGPHSWDKE